MSEELAALDRTGAWDLVPLPSHAVPITPKWVFKVKMRLVLLHEAFSRLWDEIMMRYLPLLHI
jgi:hypothetical protein